MSKPLYTSLTIQLTYGGKILMKNKNKYKIGISLLITLAFIMPSVPLLADGSTGIDEADVTEPTTFMQPTKTLTYEKNAGVFLDSSSNSPMATLDYVGGWPVIVTDILIPDIVPAGDYEICAEFERPDYMDSNSGNFVDLCTEDDTATHVDSCDVLYRDDGTIYSMTGVSYGTTFDIWAQTHSDGKLKIWVNNPMDIGISWNDPGDHIDIWRDWDMDGAADWALRYFQTGTFSYWDGTSWSGAVPHAHGYDAVNKEMWVEFDTTYPGQVGGWMVDVEPLNTLYCVVPCNANQVSNPHVIAYTSSHVNVANYMDCPTWYDLDPLNITIFADCTDIVITFENDGPETIDAVTLLCGCVDVSGYAVGLGTTVVTFTIPRTVLPVGACNENGFLIEYTVEHLSAYHLTNSGTIDADDVKDIVAFDCGDAYIKKFYEIHEWTLMNEGDPVNETEIYCTDFEDPCDFYDEWATLDIMDSTYNGAIDTWVWSDKKSNSPTHSFHCTAGDTYLPNQYDILQLAMDGNYIDVTAFQDEQIRIEFSHFMKGDAIEINGTTYVQDGGQVTVDFDTGTDFASVVYCDNDWTDESFTIDVPACATYMILNFTFWSDPAFCYEGWYIDDVCVYGIIGALDDLHDWVFVTDGHTHEQLMEGQFLEECFEEIWHAEEGIYRICVWLQALDDCHRSVNGSGEPGWADSGPFCIIVEVADKLCLADTDLYFDPVSPAWEGDDVTIYSVIENVGTLDATDVQVQVTVNRGEIQDVWFDDVENAPYEEDDYRTYRFGISPTGKADWHITEFDSYSPTHSWMYSNETTLKYKNGVGNENFGGSNYPGAHLAFGTEAFVAADVSNNPSVTFKAKWVLDEYDYVVYGIHSVDSGYTSFYATYYGDLPADYGVWPDNPFMYGVQDTWKEITIDYTSLLTGKSGDPNFNTGKLMPALMFFSDSTGNEVSGYSWSGFMVDDISISKIAAGEEIIFQDTQIIDSLNASNFTTPGEIKTIEFEWENAGVGRYVVTEAILTEDCDSTDNTQIRSYDVINYMQDTDDGTIEFIDHSCEGDDHWIISDCCDDSFWSGNLDTTMYGNNWNEVLYIAPGENKTLVGAGGQNLVIETWYQFNLSDEGLVECSPDGGQHWSTIATFVGACSTTSGDMNPQIATIAIPTGTDQIRFRFVSNNDTTNRGWFISDVFINGVIDDDCDSWDNFIAGPYCAGNWWFTPDQYYNTYGVVSMMYVVFGAPLNYPTPDKTFGCYDPWLPSWWVIPNEIYPQDINCSMDWTIESDDVFFGWYDAYMMLDQASGDTIDFEYANDGGEFNQLLESSFWAAHAIATLDDITGSELTFRAQFASDDVDNAYWDGIAINDLVFYGMKDTNAPTTTVVMEGDFDEVYGYYTSGVAVWLSATDDVTGVAATYYELDGTQYTYTGPFMIEGDGEHTLCYWSVDNEDNVETKHCITPFKIDESGPSVEISIADGPGIYLFGNKLMSSEKYIFLFGGVDVKATVSIDGAPLQTVEFYMNDELFGEDTSSPYQLKCTLKNQGSATFKVIAKDVLGGSGSASITVDTYIKLL